MISNAFVSLILIVSVFFIIQVKPSIGLGLKILETNGYDRILRSSILAIPDHNVSSSSSSSKSPPISVLLELTQAEYQRLHRLNVHSLDNCRVCMRVNESICHCFADRLIDLSISVPSSCNIDHFGWLSLELLECGGSASIKTPPLQSTAVQVIKTSHDRLQRKPLTLVLPVTLDDSSRFLMLFQSLLHRSREFKGKIEVLVEEMIVVVPDLQHSIIEASLRASINGLPFAVKVINESTIVPLHIFSTNDVKDLHPNSSNDYLAWRTSMASIRPFSYCIQMAIKLLISRVVRTEFYLTMDADLLSRTPMTIDSLFHFDTKEQEVEASNSTRRYGLLRSIFHNEPRDIHPHWWLKSHEFLFGTAHTNSFSSSLDEQEMRNTKTTYRSWFDGSTEEMTNKRGFGVTPAVLNTFGSLMTVALVRDAMLREMLLSGSSPCATIALNIHQMMYPFSHDVGGSTPTLINIDVNGEARSNESWCEDKNGTPIRNNWVLQEVTKADLEALWIASFARNNRQWSEYTLYRLALDELQIFDLLHVTEEFATKQYTLQSIPVDSSFPGSKDLDNDLRFATDCSCVSVTHRLHCDNVWFPTDGNWRPRPQPMNEEWYKQSLILSNLKLEDIDYSSKSRIRLKNGIDECVVDRNCWTREVCLFSVVQSTAGLNANAIWSAFLLSENIN